MKYFLLKFVISGKDGVKDDILMIIWDRISTVGNHVTFYTYIRTERVSIFVIILLKLNEFSYRKAQIPHRFCS